MQSASRRVFKFSLRLLRRWLSYWMLSRFTWYKLTDVSEVNHRPDNGGSKQLWNISQFTLSSIPEDGRPRFLFPFFNLFLSLILWRALVRPNPVSELPSRGPHSLWSGPFIFQLFDTRFYYIWYRDGLPIKIDGFTSSVINTVVKDQFSVLSDRRCYTSQIH